MARGAHPDTLARKLARQNAAELAALPDASGPEHIDAFASSARAYARRLLPIWGLPHHQYRDVLVTVGGMAGAACAEWHLHAWDLARAQGKDYRPADPEMLLQRVESGDAAPAAGGGRNTLRGYEASPSGTSPSGTGPYAAGWYETSPYGTGPYETGPYRAGRYDRPGPDRAVAADVATARAAAAGPASLGDIRGTSCSVRRAGFRWAGLLLVRCCSPERSGPGCPPVPVPGSPAGGPRRAGSSKGYC